MPPGRKAALLDEAARLGEGDVPADLAADVARLFLLGYAPAITQIAQTTGETFAETARTFLDVGDRLRIPELAARGDAIATTDQYDRIAIAQAVSQLEVAHAQFTQAAMAAGGAEAWLATQGERMARLRATVDEFAGEGGTITLSRLLVAAGRLSEIAARPAALSASAKKARATGPARSAANGSPRARKHARPSRS